MSTTLKVIFILAIIAIAIPLLYLGLFYAIRLFHEVRPPERILLFRAEYKGLTIEMIKLRKIRLGLSQVQHILFLNGKPAWSGGEVLDQAITYVINSPKPVLREDLEKITTMRYVLPADIEDWRGLDIWISPAQFSREDFEHLCDFIETRYQGDLTNAFEGLTSGDMTFYFRWIIYADATQFSDRVYVALKPGNQKELVVVRLGGHVDHYLEDEKGKKKLLYHGVLDTNTYHINLKANLGSHHPTDRETMPYQDFADERGHRLTDRFSISTGDDL